MDTPEPQADTLSKVTAQPRYDFGPDAPLGQMTWAELCDAEARFVAATIDDAVLSCRTNEEAAATRSQTAVVARRIMNHGSSAFYQFSHSSLGTTISIGLSLRAGARNKGLKIKADSEWQKVATDFISANPDRGKISDLVDWFWSQGEYRPK